MGYIPLQAAGYYTPKKIKNNISLLFHPHYPPLPRHTAPFAETFNKPPAFWYAMNISKVKAKLLELDGDKKIRFIFLFGSVAEKRSTPLSDVDIAIYYDGSSAERFDFRRTALGHLPDRIDLQIFQDLPLTVQKEVIAGKVLYADDQEFMIAECVRVVREFGSFEKYYHHYIAGLMEGATA